MLFENDEEIHVTGEHPFYAPHLEREKVYQYFVKVKVLQRGDMVGHKLLISKRRIKSTTRVYNI